MSRLLRNEEDFYWYKKELDLKGRYEYKHNHEPERYPCVVDSSWFDDPNGPYSYDHTFFYQQLVTCESCGHQTLVWPEEVAGIVMRASP